ncbi:MAG: DUF6029 family protein [Schleiferiaceae bacterium]|nr:DUF6029 family protein [Schleiferiaceae bacterium]
MRKLLLGLFILGGTVGFAQSINTGELHGNFQFDGQLYVQDTILDPNGEAYPDERFLGQGFMNLVYTRGGFTAGVRYENYQNVMVGFPQNYRGEGITYRFLQYNTHGLDVTAGHFYEQFGSGMILRAYEERGLGYDNVFDGARVKYSKSGITVKGIIGKQRKYFDKAAGLVRGIDGEIFFNELIPRMRDNKTLWTVGGSFVSKFEPDNSPIYNLPQNVGSWAGRVNMQSGGLGIFAEYVYKINDPSIDNRYIYKDGEALTVTVNYANKDFGFMINAKRVDNMSFRSERNAQQIEALVNFIPAGTRYHTYTLPALYPYATQITGEQNFQAEFTYNFHKGTFLGGKYGMQLFINYAYAGSIYKAPIDDATPISTPGTQGYVTDWFRLGQVKYYQDFNVSFKKKLSRKWKMQFTYLNVEYNFDLLNKGLFDEDMIKKTPSLIYLNEFVLEMQYKIKPKHYLRFEVQGLFSQQDQTGRSFDDLGAGSMVLGLVEYSISPHWFFSLQNIYNYGNPNENYRLNYPYANIAYSNGPTRVQLGYGRQPSGIFCVGGVCRFVPASNGLQMSITSNF